MRRRTYAIWWQRGNEDRRAGKLEVGPLHVLLSGSEPLAVPLDDISAAEYGAGELRIDHGADGRLTIGSLDAPGALLELFDSLRSRLRANAA